MVKFAPKVQQVGMNVSWRRLGSGGEFVVFAVIGTSGREGTVRRRNGIVTNVLSNWVWQCRAIIFLTCFIDWAGVSSSLGSGVHFKPAEETRWNEADMGSHGWNECVVEAAGVRWGVCCICSYWNEWARRHGQEKEWNSYECAIKLGMAVPCHHFPDMLQFLDSPLTDVTFKLIGLE
ncbi:hypothetical protein CSKR_108097 [Clonorchis sinensis]|uniref:Uncharacterized protein n=1 Tax=Clonorchis sinensis TaxID=79923 RepID=A0A3R7ETI8_CLOSI|nr:hypothetical protein CSKR_108097 [Clonorchis sinensis]